MKEALFPKAKLLPELYEKEVLAELLYPFLFSCSDKAGHTYLCSCYQKNGDSARWLLTRVEEKTIERMLNDQITMRDAFLVDGNPLYTMILRANTADYEVEQYTRNTLPEDILPTAGYFFGKEE